jgi:hypothetical protein
MIFNPLPDRQRVFETLPKPGETMRARYVSGLYPLAGMGPLLRSQAHQVGLDDADTWVAIADGAMGLEDFVQRTGPVDRLLAPRPRRLKQTSPTKVTPTPVCCTVSRSRG